MTADIAQRDSYKSAVVAVGLCVLIMLFAYEYYLSKGLIKGHVQYAVAINKGKWLIHPAFGIFWLASIVHHVTALPLIEVLYLLLSFHVALTFCTMMWILNLLTPHSINPYALSLFAFALMVASPIGMPFLDPQVYNFSLQNRNALLLRNATHTALLPYAIVAFGLLVEVIRQRTALGHFSKRTSLFAGIFLFLASMVKPSFTVSIVPAVMLYLLLKRSICWKEKSWIAGILLPSCFLLCGQIYIGLLNPYHFVAPMRFLPWAVWSQNNIYPIAALLLATIFPIYIAFYRYRVLSSYTIIAWINLSVAIIPYILFTCGERDLEWPYLHARIILFICSAVEWNKWKIEERYKEASAFPKTFSAVNTAGVLFALHAMFGVMRLLLVDAKGFRMVW